MYTKSEFQAKIKELLDKVSDIETQAKAEKRILSDDEVDLKNKTLAKCEEYKKIVDSMDREERLRASLDVVDSPVTVQSTRRDVSAQKDVSRIELGMDNRSRERFRSFGEQLLAVYHAGIQNGHTDPRLLNATGLGETVPSDGGFLIQTDFMGEITDAVFETGQVAQRCRRVPITGNSNSTKLYGFDETSRATGSRYGGVQGYWTAEAAAITASKPKFREINLSLNKLGALVYATEEMLQDSAQLEGIVRTSCVGELAWLLDDAIINGLGSGKPLGIMQAGSTVSQAKESGQTAVTIVAENIMKMWSRIFASSRPNAVWFINQDTEPQLGAMSFGSGASLVYMPPGGLSGQPYATLYGRPVIAIEQCATLGTVGDIILFDGDGYLLAEKGGVRSAVSIHVKFAEDEQVFRFTMRVDGQPTRASALTPANGSNTLSHFVTLATRA